MMKNYYKAILSKSPFGFAYHKIILNETAKPVDYEFIEINDAFLKLTGLSKKKIQGQTVRNAIPGIEKSEFDWISYFGKIALYGGEEVFEQFSEPLNRWYKVQVYSPEKYFFATVFTDITAEKDQAARLEKAEKRYRGLVESQSDLIVRVDKENRFTFVNEAYCKTFGKTEDDLLGSDFFPLVHEDDRESTNKAMEQLLFPPYRCYLEQRAMTVNGWRWLAWEDNAILNEKGEIVEVQGVGRDITDKKLKTDELNQYKQRLTLAQTFAKTGSWEYDIEAGKLFWSIECEALFGLKEGAFEGTFDDFLKRVHPDDRDYVVVVNSPITQLKEGVPLSYEHRIIKQTGEIIWVKETAGVVNDLSGKPAKIIGLIADITEQKIAAEAIENEEKLRQIVDNINGVFWLRSADRLEMLYVSPSIETLFGITQQELYNNPNAFTDAVHPHDKERVAKALADFLKTGNFSEEYRIVKPTGETRWMISNAFPVKNDKGETIRFAGIVNDITGRKENEIAVKQLLEANRNESEFREFLFKNDRNGLVIFDNDHKVIDVNPRFCKMTGYTADELLTMHTWDFDDIMTEKQVREGFDATQQVDITFESRHKRKDGSAYEVDVNAVSFYWKGERFVYCSCRDISERKSLEMDRNRALDLARENQKRFEEIAEFTGEFIWEVDINGIYTYVNKTATTILGYSRDDIIGKMSCFDMIPEEERKKIQGNIEMVFSEKLPLKNIENTMIAKDGRKIFAITNGIPVLDADGNLKGYRGSDRDVTEIIEKENALLASENKFRQLVESISDVLFTLDEKGTITYMSPVVKSLTGFDADKYIGAHFNEFVHPGHLEEIGREFEQLKAGKSHPLEYRINSLTGEDVWVRSHTKAGVNDTGHNEFRGIAQNITESRKAAIELKESEEKYRMLFNANNDSISIFYINDDGSPSNFIDMNETGAKIIGYSKEELLNMNVAQIEEEAPDEVRRMRVEEILQNGHAAFETTMLHKSGEKLVMEAKTILINYNGRPAILNIARNITERKKSEDALKESEFKYRNLINNLHAGIVVHNPDSTILFSNPQAASLLGLTQGQLDGKDAYDPDWRFVDEHGITLKPNEYPVSIVIESKKTVKGKVYGIDRPLTNDRVWVQVNAYPEFTQNDGLLQVVITFIDISAIKEAEESLRTSEEFNRRLLATIPDLVIRTDLEGTIVFLNEPADSGALFHNKEELIGRNMLSFIHETDIERAIENTKRMFEKPLGIQEYKLQLEDGQVLDYEVNGDVVRDAGNNPVGMVYIVRNITERKLTENALRESEHFANAIANNTPALLWIYDLEKKQNLWTNAVHKEFFAQMFNDTTELKHDDIAQITHPDDLSKLSNQIDELINDTRVKQINLEMRFKYRDDWKWMNALITVFKVNENGTAIQILGALFDIDDRKKAEEAIKQNEERFRQVAETNQTVIWELNKEGIYTYVSPMAERTWGYKPEKLINKVSYFDLHPEEGREDFRKKTLQLVEQIGEFKDLLNPIQKADGSIIWVSSNGVPVFNENGSLKGYIGSDEDVTERLRAEEELHKFKTISDQANYGSAISDLEGKILYVNKTFARMHDWEIDELIGKSLAIFHSETQLPALIKLLDELKNTGSFSVQEVDHVTKDGRIFTTLMNASVIYNDNKEPLFLASTAIDVTEAKANRLELLKLTQAVVQNPVSIIVTDTDGIIEYVNPRFTEISGYTSEEVIGRHTRIFNSGKHPENEYQKLWSTILNGEIWNGELLNKKKNGELFWEKVSISPIKDTEGNIINFVAIKEDISDQKQLLEDLKIAKEKAEESNRLKTAFMNNISHEVRTPLNGILGFGSFMLEEGLTPDEKLENYRILKLSSDRLQQTLDDIVVISELKAGTLKANKSDVMVALVLSNLLDKTKLDCSEKNILTDLIIAPGDEEITLYTDEELFTKIMKHLLDNAAKFTTEGYISFGFNVSDHMVEFFVKDTGIGINADFLERVFEPYTQEDVSSTRPYEGSGLGLAVAKGMVEMLGGSIKVESKKGEGSTFFFTLPLTAQSSDTVETAKNMTLPTPVKNPVILIAEDDEANYLFAHAVLKKAGYRTLHAYNGAQAVELCRKYPEISLILMDIKMPVLSGSEARKQIAEFMPRVPIIAYTAYAQTGDKYHFISEGFHDYLAKPTTPTELLTLLKKFITEK